MALQINDEGHRPLVYPLLYSSTSSPSLSLSLSLSSRMEQGQGVGSGGRGVCVGGGTTHSIGAEKAAAAKWGGGCSAVALLHPSLPHWRKDKERRGEKLTCGAHGFF